MLKAVCSRMTLICTKTISYSVLACSNGRYVEITNNVSLKSVECLTVNN